MPRTPFVSPRGSNARHRRVACRCERGMRTESAAARSLLLIEIPRAVIRERARSTMRAVLGSIIPGT
jgi:hypothetical protein